MASSSCSFTGPLNIGFGAREPEELMNGETYNILLVDDDEDDFLIVRQWLPEKQGVEYGIQWAASIPAAQEAMRGKVYDAILVDYQIGMHSGLDLIREVVSSRYPAPILLLTGAGNYDVDLEAMRSGAADYIHKAELNSGLLERSIRYAIEHKRIETELERRLQERSSILESIQDGLFGLDRDWRITYINPTAARSGGVESEGLVGRNFWEVFPKLKGTKVEVNFRRAMRERTPIRFDLPGVYQNRWYNVRIYPFTEGISVYSQDITEQKSAEKSLQQSEDRFRTAVENLLDAFAVLTSVRSEAGEIVDFRVEYVNQAACALENRRREDYIGKKVLELYPGLSQTESFNMILQVVEYGETIVREKYAFDAHVLNQEAVRYLDFQVTRLGDGVIATWRDVTERVLAEASLREHLVQVETQRRLLQYREQERQRVARQLHDGAVQDLSSLLLQAQLIRETIPDPDIMEKFDQVTQGLRSTINSVLEVVNEMRPPALIHFGLSRMLENYLRGFSEKHPDLKINMALEEEKYALTEQTRLSLFRIFQEALTNVARYANATQVFVQMGCFDHQVSLEVKDNGQGFAVSDLENLSAQGHYGLVIMRERAEAVGGELFVTSAPGQGTSIRVSVPSEVDC